MPRHQRLVLVLVVVVAGLSIGSPLWGGSVFAGVDLLETLSPWQETPPDGTTHNPLVSDLVDSSLPDRRAAVDRIRAGDWPQWQPDANGGRPLLAVPNAGLLSPLNLPYLVVPFTYAPGLVHLLTLLVGIGGMTAWLRRQGLHPLAGVAAGIGWMFSGFAIVYTGFPLGHIAALLPLGLWAVDLTATGNRRSGPMVLALVTAAMWFEGFPQMTVFALGMMGVWALVVGRRDAMASADAFARTRGSQVLLAGAVLAGTMVTAVQLLPFAADLQRLDLSEREQTGEDVLPLGTAATVALPNVFGETEGPDRDWLAPRNEVETHASVPVGLVAFAAVGAAAAVDRRQRRLRRTMLATGVVAATLAWVGGPLLDLLRTVPVFGLAGVHRIRFLVVLVVCVLGAMGIDRVLRARRPTAAEVLRVAGAAVVSMVLVVATSWYASRLVAVDTTDGDLRRDVLFLAVAGLLAAGGFLAGRARAVRAVLPVVVMATVLGPALLSTDYWPRTAEELFYPSTPVHDLLADELGHDRVSSSDLALFPGTTSWYGLRTAASHAFPTPEWREAIDLVDPEAYERMSPTFPSLRTTVGVASSPMLDRLGVTHHVTPAGFGLFGEVVPFGRDAVTSSSDTTAVVRVRGPVDRLRGVTVGVDLTEPSADVDVEVTSPDGRRDGRRRRIGVAGPVTVAFPELTSDGPIDLRVTVRGGTLVPVSADAAGHVVVAADDLVLVETDGALVYERPSALPRIRWASEVLTVTDTAARQLLANGQVPADTAVTRIGVPVDGGTAADLDVTRDDGDTIAVTVAANGTGLLVIADTLTDFEATVDGQRVRIVPVDLVGGGIVVPEGVHEVVVSYRPAGDVAGRWTTRLTPVFFVLLLLLVRRRDPT